MRQKTAIVLSRVLEYTSDSDRGWGADFAALRTRL